MYIYRSFPISSILTLSILVIACSREPEPRPVEIAPVGFVPKSEQRPGDPDAGYAALVNKAYISCGIPYSAYEKIAGDPRPDQLIEGRVGRNRQLPYMQTFHVSESGVELVVGNCLSCHAAYFDGQLIIGLGNESLDFTGDPTIYAERVGEYVTDQAEAAEWRKWADRVAAIAPYRITDTVGVNPGFPISLALMAHYDSKTLAWLDEPVIEMPPFSRMPASVPPWWRMKKKHAMFYNGQGRGDHARYMILASALCIDSVEEVKAIDAYAPDIRAYIASLEPPEYPYEIKHDLATKGLEIYEKNCSRCHGTYGKESVYPNLVISYQEVGTDPELAQKSADKEAHRFIRWFNESYYGELSRATPALGYMAPPLDGIWATAPFLHNGSVPTIAALLNSSTRPKYWIRDFEVFDFDKNALGWQYVEMPYGKEGAKDRQERARIYDTSLARNSNAGHTYGDSLTDEDRTAILEYLKTL